MSFFDAGPRGTVRQFTGASATGVNSAATVTLAAPGASRRYYLAGIFWSYSATPTGGRLTTTGCVGDEIDLDVTAGGPAPALLPPVAGLVNTEVTVVLAAGGAGVTGKLTVWYATC